MLQQLTWAMAHGITASHTVKIIGKLGQCIEDGTLL